MADYIDKLKSDLVNQFHDQERINSLIEVMGRQLNDVFTFFADLKVMRFISTAEGQQIDRIGEIACLTRAEAGALECLEESNVVLSDEKYRIWLIYKIWKNTNKCTYSDIMKALQMLWSQPIYYGEDIEKPATMLFETNWLTPDYDVNDLFKIPIVKAAGVGTFITAKTLTELDPYELGVNSYVGQGLMITNLPELT